MMRYLVSEVVILARLAEVQYKLLLVVFPNYFTEKLSRMTKILAAFQQLFCARKAHKVGSGDVIAGTGLKHSLSSAVMIYLEHLNFIFLSKDKAFQLKNCSQDPKFTSPLAYKG